jgi:hypothetical protein
MIGAVLAAAFALPQLARPQDALYRRTLDLVYQGSTETALRRFAELCPEHPDDPACLYFEALALAWKIEETPASSALDSELLRRVGRAVGLANERLAADPRDARALIARAGAFGAESRLHIFRLHKRDAARAAVRMRADLLAVAELDPANTEVTYGLGLYDYYADVLPRALKLLRFLTGLPAGNRQRGLARIEEGLGSQFHDVEARVQLYEIHAFYEDDQDRAADEARRLRASYPGNPLWALKLAEHLLGRLGDAPSSAGVAREALAAHERGHPNYGEVVASMARVLLAEALLTEMRTAEASAVIRPVAEGRDPGLAPRARLVLGRALELDGRRSDAEACYRDAGTASDESLRKAAHEALARPIPQGEIRGRRAALLARALYEAGRKAEAFRAYRQAGQDWPGCREATLRAAEEAVERGRADSALPTLARLSEEPGLSPPWLRPLARLLLARCHDLRGERARAEELYNHVYKMPLGRPELREGASLGLLRPFRPHQGAAGPGSSP